LDLGDIFKELVWDVLVKAAIGQLFAALPFLAWGPIGIVVSWALTLFANKLYEGVKEFVNLQAIVLRNEAHQRAYDRASVSLKIIAQQKGIESPEFKNAREDHKKKLSEFVRFAT
jgi:hypothetical protein